MAGHLSYGLRAADCGCRYLVQPNHRFVGAIDRHKYVIVVIAGNHIAGDFRLCRACH